MTVDDITITGDEFHLEILIMIPLTYRQLIFYVSCGF